MAVSESWKIVKQDLRPLRRSDDALFFESASARFCFTEVYAQPDSGFTLVSGFALVLSGSVLVGETVYAAGDCFSPRENEPLLAGTALTRVLLVHGTAAFDAFSLPGLTINELRLVFRSHDIYLGVFQGRYEAALPVRSDDVAVFVIQGAFEVNNRLVETADTLFGANVGQLEFEALSENAVLLVIGNVFTA